MELLPVELMDKDLVLAEAAFIKALVQSNQHKYEMALCLRQLREARRRHFDSPLPSGLEPRDGIAATQDLDYVIVKTLDDIYTERFLVWRMAELESRMTELEPPEDKTDGQDVGDNATGKPDPRFYIPLVESQL